MSLLLPGDLLPGAVGVLEHQQKTVQISGSSTSATVTFTLDGDFDAVPTVVTGGGIAALSGASASTQLEEAEVDHQNATADSVDVTVRLDAAPGTGETTDVTVGALFAGGGD